MLLRNSAYNRGKHTSGRELANMLSEQARLILGLIAEGRSYDQILQQHPELTYFDIFGAAREALEFAEAAPARVAPVATRPIELAPPVGPARVSTPAESTSGADADESESGPPAKRISFVERARATHGRAFVRWSRDEDARLEALFRAGTPSSEIVRQLDRHEGAIIRRLEKLGLVEAPERAQSRTRRRGRQSEANPSAPVHATPPTPEGPAVPGWDLFRHRLTDELDTT
jgi:hypothetical protein